MSNTNYSTSGHALPTGSRLHKNYIIDFVLGEGGFGITYSGTCLSTNMQVAIKEYFPSGIASREKGNGSLYVSHFDGKLDDSFQKGMQRFLNEANLLQEFQDLGSIVSIFDVFEENGTAYLVMEYIEGITLKQLILSEGPLPFDEMLTLFKPVLLDLHEVHKKGLIHRDISPDNLIVGMDNHLHLIDFGAASFENPNESKTMTVILKSGYAPPEQYISDGRIGAWTDVYALCATMYMVLNGKKPADSIKRMQHDTLDFMKENVELAGYQKDAIMRGLRLNYAERFPSVKMLYHALATPPAGQLTETVASTAVSKKTKNQIQKIDNHDTAKSFLKKWTAAVFLCVLIYCGLGVFGIHVPFWPENLVMINSDNASDIKDTNDHSSEKESTNDNSTENANKTTVAPISSEASTEALTSQILTMTDMVGKSIEDARSTLEKLDSSIEVTVTEEYNSDVAAGLVISQSIAENTQFTRGQITQIRLVVSKGATPSTQAAKNTENSDYNVKGSNESTTKKKDDGYTTIHLD